MNVWEVRTPTDLRGAFADVARVHFLAVPDAVEPAMRQAWGDIFEDFTLMEPATDPPGLIDSYLEGVGEPLARLHELGLQVVALSTRGTFAVMGTTLKGTATDFFIAPRPCWFWRDGVGEPIHLLGTSCDAHALVLASDDDVRLARSRDAIDTAFEGAAPWCPTCSLADVELG